MNRSSTVEIEKNLGNSGTSTTCYGSFKPFKTFGLNRGGLWAWPKS